MPDKIGLFTGSFDPITNGHMDLIERASQVVDRLYVGIFYNRDKKGLFSLEERERMVTGAVAHLPTVEVVLSSDELAVDVARRLQVTTFIRGIRDSRDLEYELNLHFFNHELAPDIETIFLLSHPSYQALNSSRIRELVAFKQDISRYVPHSVLKELERRTDEKTTDKK